VVDGRPFNRRVLRTILEPLGAIVEDAAGGFDAIRRMSEAREQDRPYDAAFVDFRTKAVRLASEGSMASTSFLLLSPYRGAASPEELAGLRVAGNLTSPFRRSLVVSKLADALNSVPGRENSPAGGPAPEPGPVGNGAPAAGQPGFARARVLVADDNAANQKLAKLMLERLGCRVDLVGNGAEAVNAWSHGDYDLIFMDCQMPEMDGLDATRAIRGKEPSGARTPIVALTANALTGERERCLSSGMDDYLAKPIRPKQLAEMVNRWI